MEKGTPRHTNQDETNQAAAAGGDVALESLLRTASSRPEPSEATRREVRDALHAEWRAATVRRRWRRGAAGFSLAAAAVLVLALGLWNTEPPGTTTAQRELARVERVSGQVQVISEGTARGTAVPAVETPVYVGQTIEVGANSGLALRLDNGISLRIDQNTRLGLLDEFATELHSGRVYVDTGDPDSSPPDSPGSRFQVFTPLGAVSHIGTQYMVSLEIVSSGVPDLELA
ncbi:MAG: FecR domain-containing protein, partial [Xanthomonadales bacterium]|nr:FecR domain-containing protein [Xanthomonadales bacterium]